MNRGRTRGREEKKLTGRLMNHGAIVGSSIIRASDNKSVSMTVVGLVVKIISDDFNIARVLISVDRQLNRGGGSLQKSVNNFVSCSSGNTSSLDIDCAWEDCG